MKAATAIAAAAIAANPTLDVTNQATWTPIIVAIRADLRAVRALARAGADLLNLRRQIYRMFSRASADQTAMADATSRHSRAGELHKLA